MTYAKRPLNWGSSESLNVIKMNLSRLDRTRAFWIFRLTSWKRKILKRAYKWIANVKSQ